MEKLKKLKNYFSIIDIIFCLFLGTAFSIYPEYYTKGSCEASPHLVIKSIGLFCIIFIVSIAIKMLISKINSIEDKKDGLISKLFNKENKIYKYRLFILAGIILLLWLPVIISLYPGTLSNDTWNQLNQYISLSNGEHLRDHHPVFDTIYIGSLIVPIAKLSGNWQLAFFIYVMIQAIITSLVFAYSLIFAKEKLKLNNIFIIIFLVIYAILPIFPASVQAINKDALFSWIYVLFFINFLDIVRTKGSQLENNKFFAATIVLALFCCLTKKVGMYVLLLSLVLLLLFKISNKKRIICIIASVIILMKIIMPFILEKFQIEKGGQQEKYSLFFQQTARYLKENMDDINEEDRLFIEEVIGQDANEIVKVYDEKYADPVKGYTQRVTDDKYIKYLFVWAKLGLKHPSSYIDATNCMWSGWINYTMYKPLMNMNHHNQLDTDYMDESVSQRHGTAKSAEFIQNAYDTLYKIPVIKYLLTQGMYIVIIPLFALSTTLKKGGKGKGYWIGIIPLFLSIALGCLLAPVADNIEGQRYLFPVTFTSVAVLMWTVFVQKEKEKEQEIK